MIVPVEGVPAAGTLRPSTLYVYLPGRGKFYLHIHMAVANTLLMSDLLT